MGQFKPMVKMETTEPSVELKLKKGGCVTSAKKMMNGGVMGALEQAPAPGARGGMAPAARPGKPSMMDRRKAMMGRSAMARPMMAKGGAMDALEAHAAKPASKGHAGLKTGGVAKSPKPGNYATGGVVNGQGGFKAGGIIKSEKGSTKMSTAKVNHNSAPTGEVKLGNAGGFKKGGATKKHYATGGAVNNSGHAVAMPQKAASKPVSNDRQSGTFKKGGGVKMQEGGASQAALDIAQQNAAHLKLSDRVSFCLGNWYAALHTLDAPSRHFDLILSNPPYIAADDPHLSKGDLRFEPPSALTDFGSGLTCLATIIDGALAHLKPGGLLAVEHGFDQSPAVLEQLAQAGFQDIRPHRDLAGHWRVASGRKPI
jgi:hypothetical protein